MVRNFIVMVLLTCKRKTSVTGSRWKDEDGKDEKRDGRANYITSKNWVMLYVCACQPVNRVCQAATAACASTHVSLRQSIINGWRSKSNGTGTHTGAKGAVTKSKYTLDLVAAWPLLFSKLGDRQCNIPDAAEPARGSTIPLKFAIDFAGAEPMKHACASSWTAHRSRSSSP